MLNYVRVCHYSQCSASLVLSKDKRDSWLLIGLDGGRNLCSRLKVLKWPFYSLFLQHWESWPFSLQWRIWSMEKLKNRRSAQFIWSGILIYYLESKTFLISEINSGRIVKISPTIPKSDAAKIGASASWLIPIIRSLEDMPAILLLTKSWTS